MNSPIPPPRRNPAAHLAPYRFKPGQSGNPAGRPKGRSITARLRELLDANVIHEMELDGGRTVADAIAEVIVGQCLAGDTTLIKELLDRTEGKVISTHKHTIDLSNLSDDELIQRAAGLFGGAGQAGLEGPEPGDGG